MANIGIVPDSRFELEPLITLIDELTLLPCQNFDGIQDEYIFVYRFRASEPVSWHGLHSSRVR